MPALTCKPDIEKRAFSIDEFSKRWGWGRNTTYNLIGSGKLKSAKVGTRRVITTSQEAEFAANLEAKQK
jgi:excisionase family DNA binding protein